MARPLDVLIVDDDEGIRTTLEDWVTELGWHAVCLASGQAGLERVASRVFDVILCDVRLPDIDGMTVFRRARATAPSTEVLIMTANGSVQDAVAALREGAYDYLIKPFSREQLAGHLGRIAERRAMERELREAREHLGGSSEALIGRSPPMARVSDRVETIAQSDAPVLIVGDSGTGKELVARMLHERSSRRSGPFVAVNCAAFPETLLDAELFGYERGAFTGAIKRRDGRFKAAEGGTLLLDEIAEMSAAAQAKLLRVLQEGVIDPLGSDTPVRVDVRIISATHRDLRERISRGLFREDLYYRIKVLDVTLPPLRERRGDMPLLVEHFLRKFTSAGREPPSVSPRAWAILSHYGFPGNVRELAHVIERAVVLARGHEIDLEHLPAELVGGAEEGVLGEGKGELRPLATAAKEFEREYLRRALRACGGRRQKAAELLGISRKSLWAKLREHGLSGDDEDAEGPLAKLGAGSG